MTMNIQEIRAQFSALSRQVYGKDWVYFDNAATSQRPDSVTKVASEMATSCNANIHRAVHYIATQATEAYERTRDEVAAFIGARHREEIIFTSGTTHGINLVAFSFGEAFVGEGDEIIVSEAEHHSNLVPWQLLCQRKKARLVVLPVDADGHLRIDLLPTLISPKTRLLAVAQVSNVLGIVNPLDEIVQIAHSHGVPVLVDGAQGIVHQLVNVEITDCDFYAFSGHKMYAATGTGVLYGKKALLDQMPPYMGGGEMIATVRFSGTTFAPLPGKFEAGTQNINAVPTLGAAIRFMRQLQDPQLQAETRAVSDYLYEALSAHPRIHLYGVPRGTTEKIPLFSFTVEGAHHEDLALILDKMGIAVRSGQMCAEPLMDRFGVSGMVRISLAPYNTMQEAEYFIQSLDKAIQMLS